MSLARHQAAGLYGEDDRGWGATAERFHGRLRRAHHAPGVRIAAGCCTTTGGKASVRHAAIDGNRTGFNQIPQRVIAVLKRVGQRCLGQLKTAPGLAI